MNHVSVSVFARTDIGMQRTGNEDAFLVADLSKGNIGLGPEVSLHQVGERGSLMVVSDGMGGAVAGEIASEMAVTTIKETLMSLPLDMEISERLSTAATTANARIWEHAQQNPELSGMGATLTAVLVQGTVAYIAQVGDSRAYLMRGEQIKQITKDQSLAQMLVDSGIIEASQMESVPQNVIMQALGTQPGVTVVMTSVELFRDDCLAICSDGLSNKIKPEELRDIIRQAEDMSAACRRLIEIANERGGEDNITVIVARFDGEPLGATTEGATITNSLTALSQDYVHERAPGFANRQAGAAPALPPTEEDKRAVTQMLHSPSPAEVAPQASPQQAPPQEKATRQTGTQLLATQDAAIQGASTQDAAARQEQQPPVEAEPITEPLATPAPAPAPDPLPEPVAARPPDPELQTKPLAAKKQSYGTILIIALISLLLLAAAGYFAYRYYFNRPAEPETGDVSLSTAERPDLRIL
jgi:serine/threonine protein phosphatase PrpC